jgi:hypothetical protein
MPITRLLQNTAFDQKAINAMTIAFEDALWDLNLSRSDPKAEAVARKIIECAQMGELNPGRLRVLAVMSATRSGAPSRY